MNLVLFGLIFGLVIIPEVSNLLPIAQPEQEADSPDRGLATGSAVAKRKGGRTTTYKG